MLGSEATTIIREKLGFRTDQDAAIITKLVQEQALLEMGRSLPAFLIQEDQTLSLTADVNYVTLPTGFLGLVDDDFPYYAADTGGTVYLPQANWDAIRKLYASTDNGNPKAFAIRKNRIYVAPTPDVAKTLTWSYYARAATITSTTENAWLMETTEPYGVPYLLIGRAGLKMAQNLQATRDVIDYFTQMALEWERAHLVRTVLHETAGPITMSEELL